jgi:hypothetical protein
MFYIKQCKVIVTKQNLTKLGFIPKLFGRNGFIKSTPGHGDGGHDLHRHRVRQQGRHLRLSGEHIKTRTLQISLFSKISPNTPSGYDLTIPLRQGNVFVHC